MLRGSLLCRIIQPGFAGVAGRVLEQEVFSIYLLKYINVTVATYFIKTNAEPCRPYLGWVKPEVRKHSGARSVV